MWPMTRLAGSVCPAGIARVAIPEGWGTVRSRVALPERMFQETGDGSGQCPRARLRQLSQSHVCRLLSVTAVTELLPRRFEQSRGDVLWKK